MNGTDTPFRRRAYANLCRDFIDAASGFLIEINERDNENIMTGLKNLAYCLRSPVPYFFEDTALRAAIFISYFSLPQALLAARQDRIAIKYADSLAQRVIEKDGFSSDLVKRHLPAELKTPSALAYAEQHKLKGLGRLIQRTLT